MFLNLESILPSFQAHLLSLTFLMCGSIFLLSNIFITKRIFLVEKLGIEGIRGVFTFIFDILKTPIIFLFLAYTGAAITILINTYAYDLKLTNFLLDKILNVSEFITCFWITFNFLIVSKNRLMVWSKEQNHPTLNIILPNIEQSLACILILIMMNVLIPLLDLSGTIAIGLHKVAQILLISMIGFVFYQLANICEKIIISQYISNNTNVFSARKINTQLLILKRFIIVLITIITVASILMLFDAVNTVGKGLLTTAGIVSAIGAFASQQSLSRIFAGLQIAFAQPIRIGDTVIIENEFGQIEEITLIYVVVKLWDLRRLILPTDYFTSKGLQNLTHDSSQLLGTVLFYTDYTLPVETVRKKYLELLNTSSLWDHKAAALHVTNFSEKSMELRALMSAADSSKLWELRCWIREQMMHYIVITYPECLAQGRNVNITTKPA